jgi:hypothetical protein
MRSAALITLLSVVALGASACWHDTPTPITFREGFEGEWNSWEKAADVPDDPNRPGQKVAWAIDTSEEQAIQGNKSAKFTLDGRQDDGTIWLARSFRAPANKAFLMDLSFMFWSASESFNTLAKVAAYAGRLKPQREADFHVDQAADQAAGWKAYRYQFNVHSGVEGTVWVAFGISVVWETEVAYYIDDVVLQMRPQQ